jgi:ribA/ribD-fused uncharacterized protein
MMMTLNRKFTILMMITKLMMPFFGITSYCTASSDDLPNAQVFYTSAFYANVFGKHRSAWLFKGLSTPSSKLANEYRLLTTLRLLLLIVAGDVELNPGPLTMSTPFTPIASFPESMPESESAILTSYPCLKCGEGCVSDCIQCEYCLQWEHNDCSNLTRSMSKAVDKYPNLVYLCDRCLAVGVVPNSRRVAGKMKARGVTLGKLLDTYDAATAGSAQASTQTHADEIQMTVGTQTSPHTPPEESLLAVPTEPTTQPSTDQTPPVQNIEHAENLVDGPTNAEPEPGPIIVKGRQNPMSNFYLFSFLFNGIRYKSLEHAYQSIKATICGNTSLAWDIRHSHSPQAAKKLADRLPRIATKKLHDLMFELLKAKISQCYSFRKALRKTGTKTIFHSTYKNVDLYWCTGLHYNDIEAHKGDFDGLNVFGQMLEKVRDEHLQSEDEYETRMQYLEADQFVVLLYDGEENVYEGNVDFYRRGSGYHRYRH